VVDAVGEVLDGSPGAAGLIVHSRAQVLTKTAWTPPSMDRSIVYVRDRKHVAAFDLQ
jgi:hypothetical protein